MAKKTKKPKGELSVPAPKPVKATAVKASRVIGPSTVKNPFQHDELKLRTVIAGIERKFGENTVTTFNPNVNMNRFEYQISTGSISLDLALGNYIRRADGVWQTGIAPARLVEIFGGEGAGKTSLMLKIASNMQAQGGKVAFVDAEHSLDPLWAAKLGVRLDEMLISQPSNGVQALQIVDTLARSDQVNLIIVDSVDALLPPSVLEGDIGDSTVGAVARMMGDALRRFAGLKSTNKRCNILFTNQLRSKIGPYGGQTTSGGRALPYYADYRIEVTRGTNLTVPISTTASAIIGHRIKAKVIKNKVAPPYKDAEMSMIYGVGIDTIDELIDKSVEYGSLVANGGWYRYNAESPVIAQGKPTLIEMLRKDQRMFYPLFNRLFEFAAAKGGYNPDGTRMENVPVEVALAFHNQFAPLTPEQVAEVEQQDQPVEEIPAV